MDLLGSQRSQQQLHRQHTKTSCARENQFDDCSDDDDDDDNGDWKVAADAAVYRPPVAATVHVEPRRKTSLFGVSPFSSFSTGGSPPKPASVTDRGTTAAETVSVSQQKSLQQELAEQRERNYRLILQGRLEQQQQREQEERENCVLLSHRSSSDEDDSSSVISDDDDARYSKRMKLPIHIEEEILAGEGMGNKEDDTSENAEMYKKHLSV